MNAAVRPFALCSAAIVALSAACELSAQGICPREKLAASDASAGDWFGFSVDVGGDDAVIGAPQNSTGGVVRGAAYIYAFSSSSGEWDEIRALTAADGNPGDEFGSDVAISGDFALVTAPRADRSGSESDTGATYVFSRNAGGPDNWGQVIRLEPADLADDDRFGSAVDIDGSTAVVAAPLHDAIAGNGGAVYVFRSDATAAGGWGLVKKVQAADLEAGDQFGFSVSVEGDLLVVGARRSDVAGEDSGAAYIFGRNQGGSENWGQLAKITANDTAAGDEFGSSVDLHGENVLVGAWLSDERASDAGAAYLFIRESPTQWTHVRTLTADDAGEGDGLGFSVALDAGIALVSAHRDDSSGTDAGAVYVFAEDEGGPAAWGQHNKVSPPGVATEDRFGRSLSMDGPHALVGAYQHDQPSGDAGAAWPFSAGSAADCNGNGVCDDIDIAEGTSVDFNGNGIPDECECLGDIDGSGSVGFEDLVAILDAWGPCPGCPEDLDANGTVGFSDLIFLLPAWGPCMF